MPCDGRTRPAILAVSSSISTVSNRKCSTSRSADRRAMAPSLRLDRCPSTLSNALSRLSFVGEIQPDRARADASATSVPFAPAATRARSRCATTGQTSTCIGAETTRSPEARRRYAARSGPASGVGLFARRHCGFVGVLAVSVRAARWVSCGACGSARAEIGVAAGVASIPVRSRGAPQLLGVYVPVSGCGVFVDLARPALSHHLRQGLGHVFGGGPDL